MMNATYAKQEVDILHRILEQSSYSENLEEVKLTLSQFEGKHFRQYTPERTPEKLLKRVDEVLVKYKNHSLISSYNIAIHKKTTLEILIEINIKNKIGALRQYKADIEDQISRLNTGNNKLINKKSAIPLSNYHPKFLDKIPKSKHTRKVILPMVKIFERNGIEGHVDNFELYKYIFPDAEINDYKKSQKKNNIQIANRFRSLNRHLNPLGLNVKRRFNFSFLDILEK